VDVGAREEPEGSLVGDRELEGSDFNSSVDDDQGGHSLAHSARRSTEAVSLMIVSFSMCVEAS